MLEISNNSELPAIPGKRYFTIGEVSDLCAVKPHVLRYWEDEFDHLRPEKNRSGQRLYKKKDVEQVLGIKKLLYEEKYTIAGAKKKLKVKSKSDQQLSFMYNPEDLSKWKKSIKQELEAILDIIE